MTTTRRDLVKSLAAVPVIAAIPATTSAASPVTTADELAAYKAAWDACSVKVRAVADEIVRLKDGINAALLRQAREQGLTVERDTVAWQWIIRTPDDPRAIVVHLVNGCRCERYQTYGACEHFALADDEWKRIRA